MTNREIDTWLSQHSIRIKKLINKDTTTKYQREQLLREWDELNQIAKELRRYLFVFSS